MLTTGAVTPLPSLRLPVTTVTGLESRWRQGRPPPQVSTTWDTYVHNDNHSMRSYFVRLHFEQRSFVTVVVVTAAMSMLTAMTLVGVGHAAGCLLTMVALAIGPVSIVQMTKACEMVATTVLCALLAGISTSRETKRALVVAIAGVVLFSSQSAQPSGELVHRLSCLPKYESVLFRSDYPKVCCTTMHGHRC